MDKLWFCYFFFPIGLFYPESEAFQEEGEKKALNTGKLIIYL